MVVHQVTQLFLQQGQGPQPPPLFGDASQMPGFSTVKTVMTWVGFLCLALCLAGVAGFGTKIVLSWRNPGHHSGQLGQGAGLILAGLTVLGGAGTIVSFFLAAR